MKITQAMRSPIMDLDEPLSEMERRNLIRSLQIRPFSYVNAHGRTVEVIRMMTVKHLLFVINTRARGPGNSSTLNEGCDVKVREIAEELCASRATVTRAIAAAQGRGLIEVEINFRDASRYRINWKLIRDMGGATRDGD